MNATPVKLKNGDWGARVQSERVANGDEITITTKAGKSWPARVVRVLWKGKGVAICATESLDGGPRGARSGTDSRDYCGYPCPVSGHICSPRNGPCHDCE